MNEQMKNLKQNKSLAVSALTAASATTVLYGLRRRSLIGKLFGIVPGVYLGAQAYAKSKGEPLGELIRKANVGASEYTVRIERPSSEVYEYVRNLENLPSFMTHLHEVREESDGRVHLVVKLGQGLKMAYDGMIIDEQPGELFTYRSAPEEPFEETGTLRFDSVGANATDLTVRVSWSFPSSAPGIAAAKVMEPVSEKLLAEELESLKRTLEASAPAPAMM